MGAIQAIGFCSGPTGLKQPGVQEQAVPAAGRPCQGLLYMSKWSLCSLCLIQAEHQPPSCLLLHPLPKLARQPPPLIPYLLFSIPQPAEAFKNVNQIMPHAVLLLKTSNAFTLHLE